MAGRAAALSAARCALGAATRPLSSSSSQYVHRASRGRLHRFLRATNGCRTLHTVKRATVAKAYASHSQDGNCHNAALLVAVGLGAAVATDFALGSPTHTEGLGASAAAVWKKSAPGAVPRLASADDDDAEPEEDAGEEGQPAPAPAAGASPAPAAASSCSPGGPPAPASLHTVADGATPHGYDVAPGSRYHSAEKPKAAQPEAKTAPPAPAPKPKPPASHDVYAMSAAELEAVAYQNWKQGCEKKPFLRQKSFRCPQREAADMAGGTYPVLSLEEVREDHGEEVWVCLDGGVYNVTPFLDAHPGGATRIMMAAGGDLSKFWAVYRLHNRPHVRKLLEEYRVGTLSEADARRVEAETEFSSYYGGDPVRPKAEDGTLRVPSQHPWNSEPPVGALVEHFYTPNDLFFVRNHNNVPIVDGATWELEVEGNAALGIADRTFTLEELRKFPRTEVSAALQCAGNRQEDFVTQDRPLYVAPHWRNAAIGNAKWAGVLVRDVLRECGMDVDAIALRRATTNGMKIVNFIAEDMDETGVPYAGVIPIEKVVDPYGDALLAYEMNGETLPRDHGFPVRLLAPGHAGCRNVKWVRQIVVSAEASELDSGSRLDRHFAPDISWGDHRDHVDPGFVGHNRVRTDQGPVIQTLPVQSVIAVPANRATVAVRPGKEGTVLVKGVAWSGGGRGITRVEVSADGGAHFTAAELTQAPPEQADAPKAEQGMGRNWCWHHFAQEVPLSADARAKLARGEKVEIDIVSKAVDGDFNSQPERMSHTWNVLGICVNHWARSRVTLDPHAPCNQCATEPAPGSCKWHADAFE